MPWSPCSFPLATPMACTHHFYLEVKVSLILNIGFRTNRFSYSLFITYEHFILLHMNMFVYYALQYEQASVMMLIFV